MANQKPKIVYWKPGGAVRAQQVYMDTNFLVGLSEPGHIWHNSAQALLQELEARKINLILSSLALNEAIYQLLSLEQKTRKMSKEKEISALDESGLGNSGKAESNLPWPDRLTEAVLKLPNLKNFESADNALHRQTIKGVAELGLDPTDAFHYAAARYLNCPLVSNDAGFQKIADQNLTIVTFYGER